MCDGDFGGDSGMDIGGSDVSFEGTDVDIDTSDFSDIDTGFSDIDTSDIEFEGSDLSDIEVDDISDIADVDLGDVSDACDVMTDFSEVDTADIDCDVEESEIITECEAADLGFEDNEIDVQDFETNEILDLSLDTSETYEDVSEVDSEEYYEDISNIDDVDVTDEKDVEISEIDESISEIEDDVFEDVEIVPEVTEGEVSEALEEPLDSFYSDQEPNEEIEEFDLDDELNDEESAQIIRDVVDQNVTSSVLPSSGGHWLDEDIPGDTTWILDDDAEITWSKGGIQHTMSGSELKEKYGIEGVDYSGKEPDFSPFEDETIGHVELEHFSDQRTGKDGTYASATRNAAEKIGWEPKDVESYMEEHGLTWHECGDRKTVRAIPTEINAAFKHTGGIGIERSVEAMSGVLNERYGDIALQKDSLEGTVDVEELQEAQDQMKDSYRNYKRNM